MNSTQVQGNAAVLIAFLAGILAGKKVFGFDEATWAAVLGAIVTIGMAAWTSIITRRNAQVANVNALPNVAGVITTNDAGGHELATAIPSSTVVPAGSVSAMAVAKDVTR